MITEESICQAAQRQPERYFLHKDAEGHLTAFEDAYTGCYWFRLPDGGWAWVV